MTQMLWQHLSGKPKILSLLTLFFFQASQNDSKVESNLEEVSIKTFFDENIFLTL